MTIATKALRRFAIALVSCAALAGVTACGQKGPLYLPDQGGDVVTRPAGATRQNPPPPSGSQPGTSSPGQSPAQSSGQEPGREEDENRTPPR